MRSYKCVSEKAACAVYLYLLIILTGFDELYVGVHLLSPWSELESAWLGTSCPHWPVDHVHSDGKCHVVIHAVTVTEIFTRDTDRQEGRQVSRQPARDIHVGSQTVKQAGSQSVW